MRKVFAVLVLAVVFGLFISSGVFAFKLPDSDQRKCYQGVSPWAEIPCAGTGQDGAYIINPLSYTDNGNATVTDNNTGLMWQRCTVGQNNDSSCSGSAQSYNWYKASGTYHANSNPSSQDVCGSLTLGGHSDWRLPSKKELMSIVDYNIPYSGAAINTTYFPNPHAYFWSSTTVAGHPDYAWTVGFGAGSVVNFHRDFSYYYAFYVRCVRAGQ